MWTSTSLLESPWITPPSQLLSFAFTVAKKQMPTSGFSPVFMRKKASSFFQKSPHFPPCSKKAFWYLLAFALCPSVAGGTPLARVWIEGWEEVEGCQHHRRLWDLPQDQVCVGVQVSKFSTIRKKDYSPHQKKGVGRGINHTQRHYHVEQYPSPSLAGAVISSCASLYVASFSGW